MITTDEGPFIAGPLMGSGRAPARATDPEPAAGPPKAQQRQELLFQGVACRHHGMTRRRPGSPARPPGRGCRRRRCPPPRATPRRGGYEPWRPAIAPARPRRSPDTRMPSSRVRSAMPSSATTRPRSTIATRSQTRSTSVSRWELRNTVVPRSRSAPMIVANVLAAHRIERRGRLVEDHEIGPAQQGDAQAEALLHALGERLDPVVGPLGQADELERTPRSPAAQSARGRRASSQWSASTSRAVIQPW